MHTFKPGKLKLFTLTFFSIVIIPTLLFIFANHTLITLTKLNYFFLLFAILLFVSPYGKIRLAESTFAKPRYSLLKWFGMIVFAESILGLLFYSFLHTVSPPSSFFYYHVLFFQFGLHPFAVIAIFAVALGYAHYVEKRLPLISSLMFTFQNTKTDVIVKRTIQMLLVAVIYTSIAITLSLGIIQLSSFFGTFHPGLHLPNIILTLFILAFFSMRIWDSVIADLCRKKLSVGGFLLGLTLILTLFFSLGNLMTPASLHAITASSDYWNLLIWGFGMGYAPLMGSFIARISYGRSIREIILAVCILPILSIFLFKANIFVHLPFPNILALSGPLLIMLLLSRSHSSHFFVLGFMENPISENTLAMPRTTIKFVRSILEMIILFSVVYLLFGIQLIVFIIAAGMLPWMCFLILGSLVFCKRLFNSVS